MKTIYISILFLLSLNFLQSEEISPINLGRLVNSRNTELLPIISPDGKTLYFCREGDPENIGYAYNNSDQDIWYSVLDKNGEWTLAKNIGNVLNNFYPNFLCSITPDGNMALLGNTYIQENGFYTGVAVTFRTKYGWTEPKKLKILDFVNISKYNEYCLSMDGRKLIMAVQNSESYGEKDIYVSFRLNDTVWSKPINLGSTVNTPKSEISPFLAADDKTLYFASEGHSGYGMSDLFVTRRLDSTWTNWSKPENLGDKINTENWDAYFSLDAEGKWGYFSSYKNSVGAADIFKIQIPDSLRPTPVVLIEGIVINKKTKQPIAAEVKYEILPEGNEIGIARTNPSTGQYKITLPSGSKYGFRAESPEYLSVSENIDLSNLTTYSEIHQDLELVPIEKGESFVVNNLFFGYDQTELNPESFPELNRLAGFLERNPKVNLLIQGHTDNIGAPNYNINLSNKRAKAVKDYLIEKGANGKRLTAQGKGSSMPRNDNDTDENRAKNRRVEMQILNNK